MFRNDSPPGRATPPVPRDSWKTRDLRVGLLGIGTVGAGTFRVLQRNADEIARRTGRRIHVVSVAARNLARAADIVGPGMPLTNDPFTIVNDPAIDIVVEAIGGTTVAKDLVLQAIAQGKHVVTANKALLAVHGQAIFAAAEAQGVTVAYEGAVAVSIPIIKALREGLTANRIEWVAGIINGTTNFILSEMQDKGLDFASALAEAQARGYAEADPAFDVEGIDAGHKLALLGALAFGTPIQFEQVHIEGITALQREDVACAARLGYRVKLLGIARNTATGVELRVHPTLLPHQHMLASVGGAMNGIMVKSDAAGLSLYCGAGAGSEQTASAVIADLVDLARLDDSVATTQRVPHLAFQPDAMRALPVLPITATTSRYYLRLQVRSVPEASACLARCFAAQGIPFELRLQEPLEKPAGLTQLVLLTGLTQEKQFLAVLATIAAAPLEMEAMATLRLELLD